MNNNDHIVRGFDQELIEIDSMIATMGGYCEEILSQALIAMRKRDPELAEDAILIDDKINALEREIEEQAMRMIALRQPMAQDLRQLIGAMRIATDLERIGDMGKNIARRAITIAEEKHPKPIKKYLKRMGKLVLRQLNDVLDAYSQRDAEKAMIVWRGDEEVDDMYTSIFRELLTYMMEDPRNITLCTHLLFGGRNLERIGDHTTHIARNIHFLVTGDVMDEIRPKSDDTSDIQISYSEKKTVKEDKSKSKKVTSETPTDNKTDQEKST